MYTRNIPETTMYFRDLYIPNVRINCGLFSMLYRKGSAELEITISMIQTMLEKLPKAYTPDRYVFILNAALYLSDSDMIKQLIGTEFIEFLNKTSKFELCISNDELHRTIEYAINPTIDGINKATAVLERIWKGFLIYEKEEILESLIVYLFIAMFYQKGTNLITFSPNLVSQLYSLAFIHWNNSYLRTESSVNAVINQLLIDLNKSVQIDHSINIIPTYVYLATCLLFIELDHIASIHGVSTYQPITTRLASACCDVVTRSNH